MANIGVDVTTALRSGPSNAGARSGRFHVAGITERGPVDKPVTVKSLAQYETNFGVRTSYSNALYDTARTFFEEGGSELVVSRVVGAASSKGALTLTDTAATPLPTLKIEALDPGAYSTTIQAEVIVGTGTFTLNVYKDGVRVGRYANMTSPQAVVTAASANQYVRITDLGSATVAPNNNPGAKAITALSLGADDRASVTAARVVAALDAAADAAPGCAVAAPGYGAATIGSLLLDHAHTYRKVALLAGDFDDTSAEIQATAATLSAHQWAAYGGLFYPHLTVRDGTGTRTVSPEGYVAAVRARAAQEVGYWQVPAGDRARTRWVLSTNLPVSEDLNETLADGLVNGIATTGSRVRLYNWSSLSTDRDNQGLLSVRDTLNNLSVAVKDALEPYVFATMDGKGFLFSQAESAAVGVLEPVARRGGFYASIDEDGQQIDPGYRVLVDASNNPSSSVAQNQLNVSASVRLSPTAAYIAVEIVKVPLTAGV